MASIETAILLLQTLELCGNPIHGKAALEELHPSHTDNEGKITVQHPASKLRELSVDVLPSLDVQQLTIWTDGSADGPQCCLGGQLASSVQVCFWNVSAPLRAATATQSSWEDMSVTFEFG